MPLLSVLMPAYNTDAYVAGAVASTLRALPKDAELVVYDDASTDTTADIVASITDRRVRLSDDHSKRGVVGALNHLLETTDSMYVARMDADDVCLPWRFKVQLPAVTTHPVVFGAMVPFGAGRLSVPGAPVALQGEAAALALLIDNPMAHPSLVARREVVDGVGRYRPGQAEDWELWLRLAAADIPLLRMGTPVVAMRFHPASVSAASGYRARLADDPQLTSSFAGLARRLLGTVPPVTDQELFRRRCDLLGRAVSQRARRLDPMRRAILEAALRRNARLD